MVKKQNLNKGQNGDGHGRRKNSNNLRISNWANQATGNHNNSNSESFTLKPVATAFIIKKQRFQQLFSFNTCFLDLCAS